MLAAGVGKIVLPMRGSIANQKYFSAIRMPNREAFA
jgi:hypothetical protein